MNFYQPSEHNLAVSVEAHNYFAGLLIDVDKKIGELVSFEAHAGEVALRSEISKKECVDARGCNCLEYRSRNVVVRLYCNYPIGYVYGEIEQLVPWLGTRRCFSTHHGPKTFSGVSISQVGTFPEVKYPGWEAIADFIVTTLISSSITLAMLDERGVVKV